MKILLDECPPLDLRRHLPRHEVHTAEWAGLKGLKNGQLLREVESAGYNVFLTTDQGIPHQQNFAGRKIPVSSALERTKSKICFRSPERFCSNWRPFNPVRLHSFPDFVIYFTGSVR